MPDFGIYRPERRKSGGSVAADGFSSVLNIIRLVITVRIIVIALIITNQESRATMISIENAFKNSSPILHFALLYS